MKRIRIDAIIIAVIVVVITASYLTSLWGVFLFDDIPAILRSRNVTGSHLVLSGHRWLVDLTFRVNAWISGANPFSYHIFNLIIHISTALFAYGAISRTMRGMGRSAECSRFSAAAVALIWGVHPLTTQAVTYVCQRYESFMGMLLAGVFYCFIRGVKSTRPRWWMDASLLMLMAGMASKEVMAVVPILLFIYDYVFCERSLQVLARKRGLFHIASFATLLILMLYQVQLAADQIIGVNAGARLGDLSWHSYLYTQAQVIIMYLRLALWPVSLCFDYGMVGASVSVAGVIAVVFHISAFGASVWAVAARKWWGFVGVFFYAVLAPTSSVVPVSDIAVEHRMYVPLLAVAGLFVWLVQNVCRRAGKGNASRCRALRVGMVLGVCVVFGLLTSARNMYYWSEVSMWQDVVSKRPSHLRARNDLAAALSEQGLVEQALIEYMEVIARVPPEIRKRLDAGTAMVTGSFRQNSVEYAYFVACANLGTMYCNEAGEYEEALEWYLRALRVAPFHPQVRKSALSLLETFGDAGPDPDATLNDAISKSMRERQDK